VNIIRKPVAPGNFHHGRGGHKIQAIVIHIADGSAKSCINWFADPHAHVSSNYLVDVDGAIYQFVDEKDSAAAQGIVDRPSAKILGKNPGVNPNAFCVSIEHAGRNGDKMTEAQKASSVALLKDIAARNGIPLDRNHVIGHHEIRFSKPCPGAGINVGELVALAKG
jgi:N-acetylmuramoyl-L-alanine amidase